MLMDGSYQRTMELSRTPPAAGSRACGSARSSVERSPTNAQRGTLDSAHRRTVERPAATVRLTGDSASPLPELGAGQGAGARALSDCPRSEGSRGLGSARVFHRRHVRAGKKRGLDVGPTKRGKGSKIMAITDGHGLPIAIHTTSARPAEVKLVAQTVDERFVADVPDRLIGDKAYDSDRLDEQLRQEYGTELIAPHRSNRRDDHRTQDGRPLRRYRRR